MVSGFFILWVSYRAHARNGLAFCRHRQNIRRKGLLYNWEEIVEFSTLSAVVRRNRGFLLGVRECVYFTFRGNSRFYLTNKVKQSAINRVKSKAAIP